MKDICTTTRRKESCEPLRKRDEDEILSGGDPTYETWVDSSLARTMGHT